MSTAAPTETVIRDLNTERPVWATHGLVVLYASTGGNSPEGECEEATVLWCASEAEMDRGWAFAKSMIEAMTTEPSMKLLTDLDTTRYTLVVQRDADGHEQAEITWAPLDTAA